MATEFTFEEAGSPAGGEFDFEEAVAPVSSRPQSSAVMDAFRRIPEGASTGVGQSLQGAARAGDVYQRNIPAALRGILERSGPAGPLFQMLGNAAPIIPGDLSTAPLSVYGKEYVEQPAQQAYGVDRARDQTLLGQAGSSVGQMLPTIATGVIAGPAAIPAAMAQYGLAAGEQSASEAEQMMPGNQGVTDRAFLGGAASGAITEGALGVAGRLGRIALGGSRVPAALASVASRSPTLARGIEGAAREGSQEALEQLAQNYVASDVAGYDPNRPATQGVGQAALLGGLVGGPASAAAQAVSRAGADQNIARVLADEIESAPLGRAEDLPFNQQVQLNRLAAVSEAGPASPAPQQLQPPPQEATATQEATELVSPAVRVGDRTFTANSHPEALSKATQASLDDSALGDALTDFIIDPKPENQGFMVMEANGTQKFVSRAEAAGIFEKSTGKKPAKAGMLTSEDMRDAGLFEKASAEIAAKAAPDYVAEVRDANTPQKLVDVFRSRDTSLTNEAYEVGKITDTPEKLARLRELQAESVAKFREALGRDDVDAASAHAMQGQFYREAAEFATGTASAGTYQVREMAGYEPPLLDRAAREKIIESQKPKANAEEKNFAVKWADGYIQESQGRLGANLDPLLLVAHAVKVAEMFGRGIRKFSDVTREMVTKYGDEIKPHLEEIYREALLLDTGIKKYPVETDEVKTRKSVESAIESEAIPDEVKAMLANDPASQYAVQRVAPKEGVESVSSLVGRMTEADLSAVPVRSNIYVAAKVELAKRLMREGRTDEGYNVFQNLAAEGTNFGQNIYQFTLLKSVDPTYVPRLLNQQLVRAGYDPLTEAQTKVLADKSKASIDANEAAEAAKQKWLKDPTDENAEVVDKAVDSAKEPALELQREMLKRQPKTLPQVLKAVVQGNLLTPISEVANIVGNINFMPFRAASEGGAAAIDALDSFIRKRPREILFTPASTSAAGARGAVQGAKDIPAILKRGQSDVMTGERFRGLQPMKAWKNLLTKAPDIPTVGGKVPLQDRLALAVEGTFGMPAEVMLRGLAAGDAPFKAKAHAQAVERQLNLNKMPADDRVMARKYPELFLDESGMQAVHEETLRSVFQQPSETITSLNRWIRNKGGDWGDFAATLIAPYRQTPWNLIGEIFSYNPLIGALKAAYEAKKGNVVVAERAAAKAVVGGVLTYAGWWLYKSGLLAPSLDDEDEQQKARLLSGQVLPPNHINISGLERRLTGGSGAFRPGDVTTDTTKLGLAGAHFYTTANLGRDFEKKPRGTVENAAAWLQNSIMEEARYGLNQSFLKGTATALDAVRTGRSDEFIRGLENTLLSIPVPNTVAAVSRATSQNRVVVKDDSKLKEFDNILQQRLRVFGLGRDLPVKRGLWGEPVPETPAGSNPFAYHFLDITKNQQVTADPAANEIYRLWRKSADTSVIPTPPNSSFQYRNQSYVLTPDQQSRLQELVGYRRKQITDSMVTNPNFQSLDDAGKARLLARSYATGLRIGKTEFIAERGAELEAKGKKAGFTAE